ncbi:MAG: MFS transporter [Desulfobacteraceae bacterium]
MAKKNPDKQFVNIMATSTLSRTVLNTSRRFLYPFAPFISRSLGISMTAVTSAIAVNQATSFLTIFLSMAADRTGYKRVMLAGLSLLVAGMLIVGSLPCYYSLMVGMFLCGLGKNMFDPSVQAFVSQKVPYEKRGFVIGIMEISWAASTLVGIPLIGFIIDLYGVRSPFFFLAGMGFICLVWVFLAVQPDSGGNPDKGKSFDFFKNIRSVFKKKVVWGTVCFGFFVSLGNDNFFVVYGAWLEKEFSLSIVAIGIGTCLIGLAELSGTLLTAFISDRIGLKRSVTWGVVLSGIAYAMVPVAGKSLVAALALLFAVFLFFEYFLVSFLSFCTELLPENRATMMAVFFLSAGTGRVAGAFCGGILWNTSGIGAVCILSAVSGIFALFSLALITKS